jgi:hypothetical protein
MIKNVLSDIGGIGIYGVISICLFFAVFIGAVFLSLCMKKPTADKLGALPLHDGEPPQQGSWGRANFNAETQRAQRLAELNTAQASASHHALEKPSLCASPRPLRLGVDAGRTESNSRFSAPKGVSHE